MRSKINFLVFILITVLLAACGRGEMMTADSSVAGAPPMAARDDADFAMEEGIEMEMAMDEAAGAAVGNVVAQTTGVDRVIIRTGDMSIVVTDTEGAMDAIRQMVEDNEGWVVSSNVFQYSDEALTGNMSVRVPSEGFDPFIEAIRGLSVEVTRISTTGQDVTEEYVDLSARLENLEITADRVRNFLDEAQTVEEALDVNRELSRLDGEIESLKGRLQYLDQSAAFSLISIELTPDILSQPIEVGGWQPQGAARSALETLIASLQTLVDAAIWLLIYVLPILLLIGIPAWLVIRYFRNRRVQDETADEPA